MFSEQDRGHLNELARRVADIAADPDNERKRQLWRSHNVLKGQKPVVFISPDGSWNELIPRSSLRCEDPWARSVEYTLRQRIVRYEILQDDVPIEKTLPVPKAHIAINEGWGLVPERVFTDNREQGAWRFDPVVRDPSDWKKLKKPSLEVDEKATEARRRDAEDAVGKWLSVYSCGVKSFSFHMMHLYCDLRGLGEMMMDLILNPRMVHDVISFMTEGFEGLIRQCADQGLISLNNDDTYHYTGGVGYTDELPRPDYDGAHPRLCDVWGAAEAQEFAQVSPQMHEEFVLQYERKLLEPFGLNGYGCCDDLTKKMHNVLKIPNLRRISICPWADIGACADQLGRDYIMSWKPQPAYLAKEPFDASFLEEYMTAEMAKARHGYLEIVLRDTHTCHNEPWRFTEFTAAARRAIRRVYG